MCENVVYVCVFFFLLFCLGVLYVYYPQKRVVFIEKRGFYSMRSCGLLVSFCQFFFFCLCFNYGWVFFFFHFQMCAGFCVCVCVLLVFSLGVIFSYPFFFNFKLNVRGIIQEVKCFCGVFRFCCSCCIRGRVVVSFFLNLSTFLCVFLVLFVVVL